MGNVECPGCKAYVHASHANCLKCGAALREGVPARIISGESPRVVQCPVCRKHTPAERGFCLSCHSELLLPGSPVKVTATSTQYRWGSWVVTGASVVVFVYVLLGLVAPVPKNVPTTEPVQQVATPKPISRNEFYNRINDKRSEEVIQIVGAPDSRQQSGQKEYWYYRGKTYDPLTNKVDQSAQVFVDWGKVKEVNFY